MVDRSEVETEKMKNDRVSHWIESNESKKEFKSPMSRLLRSASITASSRPAESISFFVHGMTMCHESIGVISHLSLTWKHRLRIYNAVIVVGGLCGQLNGMENGHRMKVTVNDIHTKECFFDELGVLIQL